MPKKPDKDKDLRNVYDRETASKRKVDDPDALERQQSKGDLRRAFGLKDKRKFLQVVRNAGFNEGTDEFRELVEMYDQLQKRW